MRFRRSDGGEVPKFLYLDMEHYQDMGITAEVFMRTLERPGLEEVPAGTRRGATSTSSPLADWRLRGSTPLPSRSEPRSPSDLPPAD